MARNQAIGSAGELVVQARLLVRGWTAGNVNAGGMKNAPAIDLFAAKGNLNLRIAVKATGHGQTSVQWGMKPDWQTLFKGDVRPDFVIFVWFTDKDRLDNCRIFVVPAAVVDCDVRKAHEFWHTQMRLDGEPRKDTGHVAIWWEGKDNEKNLSRGFAEKWTKYENAWDSLEQLESTDLSPFFQPDVSRVEMLSGPPQFGDATGRAAGRNECLVVFPSGKSITENARLGLSYEWSSKPCKRNQSFIGLYDKKTIEYVGKVEAITVASYKDGNVEYPEKVEAGRLTDDHQMRIERAFKETLVFPLKDGRPRRFYLVDSFFRTSVIKTSDGPMPNYQYFDLSDFDLSKSVAYDPRKNCNDYTSEELAAILRGASWTRG